MSRWVLLRGLAREAGHWGPFPDRLRAVFPAEEILTPDLPGCGRRHKDAVPPTLGGLCDAVRAEVGGGRSTWLMGLSLGGMVALDWAQRFPDEVAGLVLVNSSAGGLSPPWRRLRPKALSGLLGAAATRDLREREAKIFRITSSRPERAGEAIEAWAALAAARPVVARSAGQLLLGAFRYRPRLTPLAMPTLVAVGAGDRLCHPTCSGQLATALGAELVVHPTAGHELPFDEPAWLLEQISQWRATFLPKRHLVTKG
jgi:pimeloyl-ACP methyl ester carboxylesterase